MNCLSPGSAPEVSVYLFLDPYRAVKTQSSPVGGHTKRVGLPPVFCVFQPYGARPMANGGQDRVVEARGNRKVREWESPARPKPASRGGERQSRGRENKDTTTVAVLYPYSYCSPSPTPPPSLPPQSSPLPLPHRSRPVPSPDRLLTTLASPFSLSVAPRPPICLARLVLLYYTPAPSTYS